MLLEDGRTDASHRSAHHRTLVEGIVLDLTEHLHVEELLPFLILPLKILLHLIIVHLLLLLLGKLLGQRQCILRILVIPLAVQVPRIPLLGLAPLRILPETLGLLPINRIKAHLNLRHQLLVFLFLISLSGLVLGVNQV